MFSYPYNRVFPMKKTILAIAIVTGFVNGFSLEMQKCIDDLRKLKPNLTSVEFKYFIKDVQKLTRNYSTGKCARFTTALLDNLHERNEKAFPQLNLRNGKIVKGRSGEQTYPLTTANNGIVYAKNYKNVFENNREFVKIGRKDVLSLPENTIIIAVYQPKQVRKPGHIEVLFKKGNRLLAASDKLGRPLFYHKNTYRQVDFYYPIREDGQI